MTAVRSWEARVREYKRWWAERRAKYGPISCAVVTMPEDRMHMAPRADEVNHLFSAVFERGKRYYAFCGEEARDKFVSMYEFAEACEDPVDG